MEDKIAMLERATEDAELQVKVCRDAVEEADRSLREAKDLYRNLPSNQQETLQVSDTEIPELLETLVRAKNVYDTAQARYDTNQRYLTIMREKASK